MVVVVVEVGGEGGCVDRCFCFLLWEREWTGEGERDEEEMGGAGEGEGEREPELDTELIDDGEGGDCVRGLRFEEEEERPLCAGVGNSLDL